MLTRGEREIDAEKLSCSLLVFLSPIPPMFQKFSLGTGHQIQLRETKRSLSLSHSFSFSQATVSLQGNKSDTYKGSLLDKMLLSSTHPQNLHGLIHVPGTYQTTQRLTQYPTELQALEQSQVKEV